MTDRHERSPYHHLEQSKRQFRVLRLLNSDANDIRCELNTFSLLDHGLPTFKALSYRWGDDIPEFAVCLDGHQILIRSNLHIIMAQMVAENNRDWIFIDALCINQDDETEKLSQVSAMGEVYQRALEVIAWIVPDPDQCESDAEEASDETADGPEHTLPLSRQQVKDVVLRNSYWSRLWIVQEVLLAKSLTIRLGSAQINWPRLLPPTLFNYRGLPFQNENILRQIRCPDVSPLTNKTAAENILFHRKRGSSSLRAGNRIPFYQAFAFFAMQDCARPHDKVFGYLGLTKSRIQVDYSVSIIDLFVATLADYLMSVGLITDDLTPIRRRMEYMRTGFGTVNGNKLITAIAAFNLDLHDPVVNLLFYEVLKFFVPGWEKVLHTDAMIHWWMARYVESAERDLFAPIPGD
ncbi:hypothetical protein GT037_002180 [Alternaria burnsii]|uniref:Heterokaryon incompatibility domain-containing protein n=1 Tax=Alternaria burnsii TaxID=1187904 RepID=A0A8H7BAQ1_9PLEO|nr:uncharacterized protein GT037_002180 [Alternaria burnsii]KAF7680529.1 hypothetical protein GT037_002180 [Alternaria burnsii]